MVYEIRYFEDTGGKSPFIDWLESLKDRQTRAIIKARLDRLSLGLIGHTRSVGGGVHELKIDFGGGYRLYYGNLGKTVVILLVGGTKRTQESDIEKAKSYWEKAKAQN